MTPLIDLIQNHNSHFMVMAVVALVLFTLGKAIPTRLTIGLFCIPFLFSTLGFIHPFFIWGSDLLNLFLPIVLLADRFLLSPGPESITVHRIVPSRLSIGRENLIRLEIHNQTPQELKGQWVEYIPEIAMTPGESQSPVYPMTLAPYSTSRLTYTIIPKERGTEAFGPFRFRYPSKLKLLSITKREIYQDIKTGEPQVITVYPDLQRIQQMRVRYSLSATTGQLLQKKIGIEGTQFSGLRAYVEGDDVRKIDWRATARTTVPIMRSFDTEVDQPIFVIIDAGRKMEARIQHLSKLDWALNATLSFASVALERGDQLGVGVFHQEIVTHLPLGSGNTHGLYLLEKLHNLQAETKEPDYVGSMMTFARYLKRRSLVIVFTDLIDPLGAKQLIQGLKTLGPNHLLVVVTLSDSDMESQAQGLPKSPFEAAEKSVAQDFMNLRLTTVQTLTRGLGATVIDVSPEEMDEALINTYLTMKMKNRL